MKSAFISRSIICETRSSYTMVLQNLFDLVSFISRFASDNGHDPLDKLHARPRFKVPSGTHVSKLHGRRSVHVYLLNGKSGTTASTSNAIF